MQAEVPDEDHVKIPESFSSGLNYSQQGLNCLTLGTTGPLFDEDGQVLTHTMLGSWEDFQQEAIKRGDIEVHVMPCLIIIRTCVLNLLSVSLKTI